jgi:hypothetical protein
MNDREALQQIKRIVDAQLPLEVAPAPTPTPTPTPAPDPTPAPAPTPLPDDPCAGLSEPRFLRALAEGRELTMMDYVFRGRGLSDQERACMAAHGIPKQSSPSTPAPARPTDLGWSAGQTIRQRSAVATYTVTPSAQWLELDHAARASGGQRPYLKITTAENADTSPVGVSMTIAGVTHSGGAILHEWTTREPSFPAVTGNFAVTIKLLDAQGAPMSGTSVSVQMQHSP